MACGRPADTGEVAPQTNPCRYDCLTAFILQAPTRTRTKFFAGLKAGLQLTSEQEKNWPAFEQAMRDIVKLRIERMQARLAASDQSQPTNPFDRLQHRADAMSQRAAALKHLAEAGVPLYQSLNDAQKRRFTVLARMLRPHHHMPVGNDERWREGHDGGDDYRRRQFGGDSRGLVHEPGSGA